MIAIIDFFGFLYYCFIKAFCFLGLITILSVAVLVASPVIVIMFLYDSYKEEKNEMRMK